MSDDADPTLPATRLAPTRDALIAPIGHYPVEAVPEVLEAPEDPYAGLSELTLTTEERKALTAELPADLFDLLPSGEVFLPQIHYRNTLNRVFGPGAWGLRPLTDWRKDGNTLSREWALYVRGKCVGQDVGEQDYIPGNRRMSWATAATASKSNAILRICKDLGIAAQAWDKRWAAFFQETYGLRVFVPDDNGKLEAKWRLKSAKPFEGYVTDSHGNRRWGVIERGPVSKPQAAIPPVATATDDPVDSGRRAEVPTSGGVGGSRGVREGARDFEHGPRPPAADDAPPRGAIRQTPPPQKREVAGSNPAAGTEDADEPTDFAAEMRANENAVAQDRVDRGREAKKPEETREHFIGVISDAQHKGLWAEAHRTWGDDCSDPLHALIERYSFKSTKQIKRVALPAIMQAMARIQAEPARPEPPPAKPAARLVPWRVRR